MESFKRGLEAKALSGTQVEQLLNLRQPLLRNTVKTAKLREKLAVQVIFAPATPFFHIFLPSVFRPAFS